MAAEVAAGRRHYHARLGALLAAALATRAVGAHLFRVCFAHVFAIRGLPVIAVAIAVVDAAVCVNPDLVRPATWCGFGFGLGECVFGRRIGWLRVGVLLSERGCGEQAKADSQYGEKTHQGSPVPEI